MITPTACAILNNISSGCERSATGSRMVGRKNFGPGEPLRANGHPRDHWLRLSLSSGWSSLLILKGWSGSQKRMSNSPEKPSGLRISAGQNKLLVLRDILGSDITRLVSIFVANP